jgi:hypothetical protein
MRRNPNSLSLSSMAKNEGAVVNISKNLQQPAKIIEESDENRDNARVFFSSGAFVL